MLRSPSQPMWDFTCLKVLFLQLKTFLLKQFEIHFKRVFITRNILYGSTADIVSSHKIIATADFWKLLKHTILTRQTITMRTSDTWISRKSCMQILSVSEMLWSETSELAPARLCTSCRIFWSDESVFLAWHWTLVRRRVS